MFTKTKPRESFSLVTDDRFASGGSFSRSDTGTLLVTGKAIFRSGTFRNSWGEQVIYETVHIDQMVSNFEFLGAAGIFADVPVRKAHPEPWFRNSTEEVIGYIKSLRAEDKNHPGTGKSYRYLVADYEILDADAAEKIEKGLYRNRSAEVGVYADNDDTEFYPTLLGFAYVDIPAVEGLNFGKRANVRRFAMENGEMPMEDEENPEVEELTEEIPEETTEEVTEEVTEETSGEAAEEAAEETPEETPEVESVNPSKGIGGDAFVASGMNAFSIEINGVKVTDPAVIQEYVNNLHNLHVTDRKNYVKELFSAKKIFAGMKGEMEEFVGTLTTDQWSTFRKMYDDSPAVNVIEFRSEVQGIPERDGKSEVQKEVLDHLSRGLGDRVKETEIYKRLHESDKEGNK